MSRDRGWCRDWSRDTKLLNDDEKDTTVAPNRPKVNVYTPRAHTQRQREREVYTKGKTQNLDSIQIEPTTIAQTTHPCCCTAACQGQVTASGVKVM